MAENPANAFESPWGQHLLGLKNGRTTSYSDDFQGEEAIVADAGLHFKTCFAPRVLVAFEAVLAASQADFEALMTLKSACEDRVRKDDQCKEGVEEGMLHHRPRAHLDLLEA